jgi:hypothetical protein
MPAVIKSTVEAVQQDDEPMADAVHDNDDGHNGERDDEHDDEHHDDNMDLDFETVTRILSKTYPFFDDAKLTRLTESYLLDLNYAWHEYEHEDKCSVFLEMLKKEANTMEELNDLIKETFYEYLSEPCGMHDGSWHPDVIKAFTEWGRLHQLDLFQKDSGLHLLLVDNFPSVKRNMDEKIKSDSVNTWDSFAMTILQECKEHPGALQSEWEGYDYEIDFRQYFKPDPNEK